MFSMSGLDFPGGVAEIRRIIILKFEGDSHPVLPRRGCDVRGDGPACLRLGGDGGHSRLLVLVARQHRDVLSLMNEQDRRRKRALITFQILVYGALLTMFLIQLQMLFDKGW